MLDIDVLYRKMYLDGKKMGTAVRGSFWRYLKYLKIEFNFILNVNTVMRGEGSRGRGGRDRSVGDVSIY